MLLLMMVSKVRAQIESDNGIDPRGREGSREKKWKRQRAKGSGSLVVHKDGQAWLISLVVVQETVRGWEKRRRELMERWEAPPPGPPAMLVKV